jgi:TDG/mug DNA glycosylase family protein
MPDVLPDVLAPDLRILFCGSAVGRRSAQVEAYYAGPGNLFWPTLHKVGLTPRRIAPAEYRDILAYGLGLTDLAKGAFGSDHELPPGCYDPERLRRTVLAIQPRILAFTSKAPAKAFLGRAVETGLQAERIGRTEIFVLPSPSGRARRFWNEDPWRGLAKRVRPPEFQNENDASEARH